MTTIEHARRSENPYRNIYILLALLIPFTLLGFAKSYFNGVTFSGTCFTFTPL